MKTWSRAVFAAAGVIVGAHQTADAANLIVNGNFAAGNTGFMSQYAYAATIYNQGQYTIGVQPEYQYNTFFGAAANFPPPTGAGSPNMMLINGGSVDTNVVWSESGLSVAPNTTYYFSAYITSLDTTSPATINFSIDGTPLGSTFTPSSTVGNWQQFYATWNSGSNTVANVGLVDTNTSFYGNDFALDVISLSTTGSGGTPVGGTGGVPEPETWALMLVGFGLVGKAARRRARSPLPTGV